MSSRAAARRRKKARNSIFDLADTPKREASGRPQRASTRAEREPDGVVLQARARRMGKGKASDMNVTMLSEDAGMAICDICAEDQAKRLWDLHIALTSAEVRYHKSIGVSPHPKCAKIEMMQERFETRADDKPDLRTEEERDRQAQTAWMHWQGQLGCLLATERTAINLAMRYQVELWDDGKPTAAGRRFVAAMQRLDAIQG